MIKQTVITVLGAAAFATSAQAEIEYDLTVGAHSHYVWRGVDQGGGQLIDTSLTASTVVNGTALSANVWYGTTGNGGVDEINVVLAGEKDFGFATLGFGAIYYGFPDNSAAQTTELYISASRDLFAGISGSFTYYKDVDANDNLDGYIELGLSKEFDFGTFVPAVDFVAGYNVETDKFTHYQLSASTSYKISENASWSPYLAYAKADSNPGDEFFGGVTLSVAF